MKTDPVFVGIDISKASIDVELYPASDTKRFANDEVGRKQART